MGATRDDLSFSYWEPLVTLGDLDARVFGFDTLIQRLAENLDIRYDECVKSIDYSSTLISVATNHSTYLGKKVIITLL